VQYYLALGDSLAAGYQPQQDADQGYTNQLDAQLRSHDSVAVARVCEWTWMCAAEDEHANTEGYGVIAAAIYAVLPANIAE
jgi:lysophospholipase L1-like esterase